jgi:type I restriction enzyme S subunit
MKLLKDIVSIEKGKRYDLLDEFQEGAIRVFQANDFRNENKPQYTLESDGVLTNADDILVVWDGSVGQMGFGKTGYVGSTIVRVRMKNKNEYSPFFIYKFLQTKSEYLKRKSTGATIMHINRKSLEKLVVPSISLPAQLRIASLLSQAEALIEQRKQSIALLDEFLKSVFLEMFGDPVRNEKGWEKVKFKQIASIDRTQALPIEFTKEDEYLGLEDIEKVTGNIVKTSMENAEDLKSTKFRFTPNHILYGKLRPYLNKVAFPSNIGICSTDIYPIYAIKNIANRYFVGYLMRSNYFVKQMILKTVGANLPRASSAAIENLKVYCPPLPLQTQFAAIVSQTEAIKEDYKRSLGELENLYGCLSQRAFKGEL